MSKTYVDPSRGGGAGDGHTMMFALGLLALVAKESKENRI